jgi:hypothetical protein
MSGVCASKLDGIGMRLSIRCYLVGVLFTFTATVSTATDLPTAVEAARVIPQRSQ